MATENLNLESIPSDPIAAKHALDRNFNTLDALLGGLPEDFTQGAAVADSTAVDVAGLVADFNDLLASLRAANVIATA